ncbi:MAG: ATPase, T2SS/T4P/T4SS family [Chloroflexi bacterium]|nr:ATPase, T2SS/T4P/T4SS family [Chloroflexota bacterium]
MDDASTALNSPMAPPFIRPLDRSDLALIEQVREELVLRAINPPGWRETDSEKRRHFFDEVRSILISRGEDHESVNCNARLITDALSGVGVLDQLLRDPKVEEIFVRNGEVALEYDGRFYPLGKLADDRYFENLVVHVADQGGATLRGDRPAVLIDLPGGERFTAIVPRLSTEGTAINIRTFGRRVRTLEEMEARGTFSSLMASPSPTAPDSRPAHQPSSLDERLSQLQDPPGRFLAWLVSSLSGSLMIAGEMGSGKTTLLNALSGFLPASAPVAALETFRELEIQHPFLLRAIAPAELAPGTPGVTLDWVLNVIYTRMNPAAILVGEVVGKEALQFLRATCLGRKALTTIHGGSIEEALMRLEQLALAASPELGLRAIRSMVAAGLDVVVLMGRGHGDQSGRRILRAMAWVRGLDREGNYDLEYLYRVEGEETGDLPAMYQELARARQGNISSPIPSQEPCSSFNEIDHEGV